MSGLRISSPQKDTHSKHISKQPGFLPERLLFQRQVSRRCLCANHQTLPFRLALDVVNPLAAALIKTHRQPQDPGKLRQDHTAFPR